MGLRLFFLPNFPGATFIQGGTFIPDSRARSVIDMSCFAIMKSRLIKKHEQIIFPKYVGTSKDKHLLTLHLNVAYLNTVTKIKLHSIL